MELFHRDLGGTGRPIVILHGLFGSSRNWTAAGAALKAHGRVFALDLRNHGRSPHAPTHSLEDLADDLEEWVSRHLGEAPVLVGHSMGGLAAMACALRRPARAAALPPAALVVVDMAPRAYPFHFEAQLAALALDLSRFSSREELERALEPLLPDRGMRQFLLMSAERAGEGYRWVLNGEALRKATFLEDAARLGAEPAGQYRGPALFLAGERSDSRPAGGPAADPAAVPRGEGGDRAGSRPLDPALGAGSFPAAHRRVPGRPGRSAAMSRGKAPVGFTLLMVLAMVGWGGAGPRPRS